MRSGVEHRAATNIAPAWLAIGLMACTAPSESEPERHIPVKESAPLDVERLSTFGRASSVVGELIYVPVYSQIFHRRGGKLYKGLATTLSVHNVSLVAPVYLTAVTYFGTSGRRLKEFVSAPISIGPLATRQFFIPPDDPHVDTGANYVVKWEADQRTARPLVEALIISTSAQQGISLMTDGRVIKTLTASITLN